jgi:hypothetical protein
MNGDATASGAAGSGCAGVALLSEATTSGGRVGATAFAVAG